MPTSPTAIDALPTPPSRDDPANFAARGDAFLAALPTFRSQTNSAASNVYANAGEAATAATTATTQAGAAATSASAAAASAASALSAPGTNATSTSSVAVGAGSKTFTIQTGKAFVVGQFVTVASVANTANFMLGQITAHNAGTGSLTVSVSLFGGSGTLSDWSIGLTAPGDVTRDGTQTLTNKTIEAGTFTNGYTEEVATANTGTAYTIDLANGTVQILTLTGNCTFTFPSVTAGRSFILLLKQDGTGSRTVTWPATVKWPGGTAPTITSTASRLDKFVFTADGTNWYGSNGGQNYTV